MSYQGEGNRVLSRIYVLLGILIPLLVGTAVGVLSMSPPKYEFARASIIAAAFCLSIISILPENASQDIFHPRLAMCILGVIVAIIGEPIVLSLISAKEAKDVAAATVANSLSAASANISELSDEELRVKASKLAKKMREFEDKFDLEIHKLTALNLRGKSPEARNEEWREYTEKIINAYTRKTNDYRRLYFPELLSLIREMQKRIPKTASMPNIPMEASPAMEGMMAGIRPASGAADYLEAVAALLP